MSVIFSDFREGLFFFFSILGSVTACAPPMAEKTPSPPPAQETAVLNSRETPDSPESSTQERPSEVDWTLVTTSASRGGLSALGGNAIEGGSRRRLVVFLTACPRLSSSFEIRGEVEGGSQVKTTQKDGCLYWEDHLDFDVYGAEHWIQKTYSIKSLEKPEKIEKTSFYLNPWQTGSQFSWDPRNGEPPQTPVDLATPALSIQDVVYLFTGQNYALDQSMELVFKKIYQLRFQPFVKRFDFSNHFSIYEPARDGLYRLRVMVLGTNYGVFSPTSQLATMEEFVSQYKYLSGAETQVEVRNGVVLTHIELPFSFQDIPWLAARTQFLLELSPLEGTVGPLPTAVVFPFNAVAERGISGTLTLKTSLSEMTEKVVSFLSPGKFSVETLLNSGRNVKSHHKEVSESVLGVRPLTAARIQKFGLTAHEIEAIVSGAGIKDLAYSHGLAKLCSEMLGAQSATRLAACKAAPLSFLKVTSAKKVKQVKAAPVLKQSRVSLISFNASMTLNHEDNEVYSEGRNKGKSIRYGVNSRAGLNLWVFSAGTEVGASKNTDWYTANTISHSDSHLRGSSVNSGKMLMVEEMEFNFEAEYSDCVYISPLLDVKHSWAEQLCSKKSNHTEHLNESWYYIYQAFLNTVSPMRDSLSLAQSPWIKLIRGRQEFERFKELVEDHRTYLLLSPSKISGTSVGGIEGLAEKFTETHPLLSDSAIPGMLMSTQ